MKDGESCSSRTPASTRARRRTIPPSSQGSPSSATSTSTTLSRRRIAPTPRPRAWRTSCPPMRGRAMQAELEALTLALGKPARPVAAIVGGAKVSTKLDLLGNLVKKVDMLIIGGGMANTFLFAEGKAVGKSLCEKEMADTAALDPGRRRRRPIAASCCRSTRRRQGVQGARPRPRRRRRSCRPPTR